MQQLNPMYLSFDEMLQKRLFEIPTYQRAYSWNTKQRNELFSDITKLYESPEYKEGRTHFMATVVCHSQMREEAYDTDVFSILNIVDGQQRITTLIILLKAIHKKMLELDNIKYRRTIFYLEELMVKDDNKKLILIQTNHNSSIALREYLLKGVHPTEDKVTTHAIKTLKSGFMDCERFVENWCEKHEILDLLMLIRNKLFFILHILNDEGSVYTVFEVLNSRGLDVDWLDKCKSMLLGIAFEKLSKNAMVFEDRLKWLHEYWGKIYEVIGITNIPGDEIVRFAATLYNPQESSKVVRIDDAIEYFKEICDKDPERVIDISQWLAEVTSELKILYTDKKKKAVTKIIQARLLAVAINLSPHLSTEQSDDLMKYWEKITFRVFGLYRKDSRHQVGEFVRLACFLMGFKEYERANKYSNHRYKGAKDSILEIAKQFPLKEIGKTLGEEDSYSQWKVELRYFLYNYEKDLAKNTNLLFSQKAWENIWSMNIEDTIEHIYPQVESLAWRGKVTKRKQFHCNRIGNLMLLPRKTNSKVSNQGYIAKSVEYKKTDILAAKDLVENYEDWDYKSIEHRTQKLISWANIYWEIDGE
ncbi:DUF262 domain-containing protein [Psychrobacillus sp. MER TA 171]|uniref:DUF262 domain-containing protein n=1 Tax=Psychrobacillus sp. MER TA 171 TaxID=2939577 RepID=UPI0020423AE2|nr:DUF262 domain-containing protein [Psychrobacillus sp. MER TA 171]MCM3359375.1 DUF262 domain-containing HNH endonuclease family protein [Psychrobacillus sp. MER TA 171]